MKIKQAADFIADVSDSDVNRYKIYMNSIRPVTSIDLFKRWLFAFSSVHTTWKYNCNLYLALSYLDWLGDESKLRSIIVDSKAGLYNTRTKFISEFSNKFWSNPDWYWKRSDENWVEYRDRVCEATVGIGRAKSSFVVEMSYPSSSRVICTDTHVMQWHGFSTADISKGKVSDKTERLIEECWVELCRMRNIPPVVARWISWDKQQKQPDSRYWTRVFEQPKLLTAPDLAKVAETVMSLHQTENSNHTNSS